jgi:hypothetical protein
MSPSIAPALGPSFTRLRVALTLSWIVVALAALAAGVGLFAPSVYRSETAWVIPQNRGQDLVTLIALAMLAPTLVRARRGSPRATLVWLGLLGYLAYTYTGAALSYRFNELFPVYVALFACLGAALIAALSGIDAQALQNAFDDQAPCRGVIVFLLIMAAVLCLLWTSQIVPFYTRGTPPPMVTLAQVPTVFVYVLDLGVVVPLALLSAWWLSRRQPWGFVLAGMVLVKAATMGWALLAMTLFAWRAGQDVEFVLSAAWLVLAAVGTVMAVGYFGHCRGEGTTGAC